MQLLYRFLVGGIIVTLFAATGDALKPKSFAGLFGTAPSVAIATLSLALLSEGKPYAALEARSMIAGALALLFYAYFCMVLMKKCTAHALVATLSGLAVWLVVAIGAWLVALR